MAVRQYIGARYVPKYDGDWDATKNYEPLTIVTDANGNSFTSLKDVPEGTPLTDRSFWIQTSSFSGAVEAIARRVDDVETDTSQLKQDVLNIENEISSIDLTEPIRTVKGSEVMTVFDSFGTGGASAYLAEYFSGSPIIIEEAGAGIERMAAMIAAYSGNKNAVKSIICMIGNHSLSAGQADISRQFETLKAATNQYVNAHVYIVFVAVAWNDDAKRVNTKAVYSYIVEAAKEAGYTMLGNANKAFFPNWMMVSNDGVHGLPQGYQRFANLIFNMYAYNVSEITVPVVFDGSAVDIYNHSMLVRFKVMPQPNMFQLYINNNSGETVPVTTTAQWKLITIPGAYTDAAVGGDVEMAISDQSFLMSLDTTATGIGLIQISARGDSQSLVRLAFYNQKAIENAATNSFWVFNAFIPSKNIY